jgi:hypothetical protein
MLPLIHKNKVILFLFLKNLKKLKKKNFNFNFFILPGGVVNGGWVLVEGGVGVTVQCNIRYLSRNDFILILLDFLKEVKNNVALCLKAACTN